MSRFMIYEFIAVDFILWIYNSHLIVSIALLYLLFMSEQCLTMMFEHSKFNLCGQNIVWIYNFDHVQVTVAKWILWSIWMISRLMRPIFQSQ